MKCNIEVTNAKYVMFEHIKWLIKGTGMNWSVHPDGRYPWLTDARMAAGGNPDYFWDISFPLFYLMASIAQREAAKEWSFEQFMAVVMSESKGVIVPDIVRQYGPSILKKAQGRRLSII